MIITEVDFKLINELKKNGHEMLWQQQHRLYKNNSLRHQVWTEIGYRLDISPQECQRLWKLLKGKYSRAKSRLTLTPQNSGSPHELNVKIKKFIKEMYFFEASSSDEDYKELNLKAPTVPQLATATPTIIKREDGLEVNHTIRLPTVPQLAPSASRIIIREDGLELNHPRKYRVILPKAPSPKFPVTKTEVLEEPVSPNLSKIKMLSKDEIYQIEALEDEISYGEPKRKIPSNSPEKMEPPQKSMDSFKRQSPTETTGANNPQEKPYDQFGKYIAAELRHLPNRDAILLQQELQNCITQAKLSSLDTSTQSPYSNTRDILHVDVTTSSTYSSNDESNDYDVLSESLITTFGANDK